MTPLHVAAFYGSCDVMKLLLHEVEGIDVDALDFGSCENRAKDKKTRGGNLRGRGGGGGSTIFPHRVAGLGHANSGIEIDLNVPRAEFDHELV